MLHPRKDRSSRNKDLDESLWKSIATSLLWAAMDHNRNRVADTHAVGKLPFQRILPIASDTVGMFEWDLVTGALTWGEGDEARFNMAPGTIEDLESWSRHVVPEDVISVKARIAEAAEQRQTQFNFHYRLRGRDGDLHAIEGVARCLYDRHGTMTKMAGVNLDVTGQMVREAALRDREAQLEAVFAATPSAMIIMDAQGVIRSFSGEAERLLGYDTDTLAGENIAALVPDSARNCLNVYFNRHREAGASGKLSAPFKVIAKCRGGLEVPVELYITDVTTDGDAKYVVFVRDISERAAAEQAENDLRNELAQLGRGAAMGELAASLAHELNQPLSATANFLAATSLLVERGGDRDKVAELVKLANDQIQRAGSIIRNIREFIVKRDVEIGIEPVEKTILDSVALVLVGAARLDIEVRYAFDQTDQFMLADKVQIQQVLVNLLRNAAEALRDQPKHRRTILIAVRSRPGDMIEISVSDTGDGIDRRILEKLFRPLSSTKGSEGMGLGLSICRRIVEAHGGTLSAENRSAGGATFRFTLPAGDFEIRDEG